MTIRPFASLLIACALLAPPGVAPAEEKAAEKSDEAKTAEQAETADKSESGEKSEAEGKSESAGKSDSAGKSEAAEESESGEKSAATEKSEKSDAGDKSETKTDKPAADDATSVEAMEARAKEAYERGEYTQALPLLNKLKERYKDDAAKLKPVEERIADAQKKLAEQLAKSGKTAPGGTLPGQAAPAGPPSNEERKPHPAPKAGAPYAITIQELGNFQFDQDKGGNIPKDVQALKGSTVRLTGYMIPLDQADKIKQFVLVPDLFACCFGQPPQVQHSVIVTCPEGKAVSYFPDQIQVEGKLNVEEKKDDGYIVSIFEVACTSVKPAPK